MAQLQHLGRAIALARDPDTQAQLMNGRPQLRGRQQVACHCQSALLLARPRARCAAATLRVPSRTVTDPWLYRAHRIMKTLPILGVLLAALGAFIIFRGIS